MSDRISIAAALRRAKRIKGQIAEQTTPATAGAVYVEGKEPAFTFAAAVETRKSLVAELLAIEVAVAQANANPPNIGGKVTTIDGKPVLYVIRKLAELKGEIAFYRALPVRAKEQDVDVEVETDYDIVLEKHVRREKKTMHISAITQAKRAAHVEKLQLEFETLNAALESHNHQTMVEV